MSCENKDKYSIHEICNSIKNQELILPDIQRKFVWDERKIICLFDSIMRGYPINTLMFWKLDTRDVTYAETIGKTKFYKFLDNYTKDADNENDQVKTPSGKFDAVIDGQQRLTCLYLGFYGTISGEKRLCVSLEKKETSEDDEDGDVVMLQIRTGIPSSVYVIITTVIAGMMIIAAGAYGIKKFVK